MPIPGRGLPVSLVLTGRPCLVVGGGSVALRKAASLLEAGGVLTMVAPHFDEGAAGLDVRLERRLYERGEAARYHLVVTATGVPSVDGAVFEDAERAGVLINAADDPEHCTFILPAVHRIGPVSVAVSTDGHSPALAGWLRDQLALQLDADLGELAARLASLRGQLAAKGAPTSGRDWRALIGELHGAPDPEEVAGRWLAAQLAPLTRRRGENGGE